MWCHWLDVLSVPLTRGVVTSYSISVEMFANGWGESVGWVGDIEHMVGRV